MHKIKLVKNLSKLDFKSKVSNSILQTILSIAYNILAKNRLRTTQNIKQIYFPFKQQYKIIIFWLRFTHNYTSRATNKTHAGKGFCYVYLGILPTSDQIISTTKAISNNKLIYFKTLADILEIKVNENNCLRIYLVNRCLLERFKTHKTVEPISELYSQKTTVANWKGIFERNLTAQSKHS